MLLDNEEEEAPLPLPKAPLEPEALDASDNDPAAATGVDAIAHAHAVDGPTPPPPLDPRVLGLVLVAYDGDRARVPGCDVPVFHGHGRAVFATGFTYEGPFVRGRMHGPNGRLAWADGVVYEGAFADNALTGRGRLTWPNGSTYEGDVVDGRRHGHGVFVTGGLGAVAPQSNVDSDSRGDGGDRHDDQEPDADADGAVSFAFDETSPALPLVLARSNARYEGEWRDGLPHGRGIIVYDDDRHVRYEGDLVAGRRHGRGEMRYASGGVYRGEWRDDVKCGHGTMLWGLALDDEDVSGDEGNDNGQGNGPREKYVGEWRDDRPHGHGRHVWLGGPRAQRERNWYDGAFARGARDGPGTFFYANGARYEGQWRDNRKHGPGVFFYEDGRVFCGEFRDDRPVLGDATGGASGSGSGGEDPGQTQTPASSGDATGSGGGSAIRLHVDDLLLLGGDADSETRARRLRLLEHAVLRVNTELRGLYRQYIAAGAPTTSPLPSPTRQASPTKHQLPQQQQSMVLELTECRRLLADCGLALTAGELAATLRTIREAQRRVAVSATGASSSSMARIPTTTSVLELAELLPEVLHPERLVLFREFVELLVRLAVPWAAEREGDDAHEEEEDVDGGNNLSNHRNHRVHGLHPPRPSALADAFAGFYEHLVTGRQRLVPDANGAWAPHELVLARELPAIYLKHHAALSALFRQCLAAHTGRRPETTETEATEASEDEPRASMRAVLAVVPRALGLGREGPNGGGARALLGALQRAWCPTSPASPDPFFLDVELEFGDFLDALAVLVATSSVSDKQPRTGPWTGAALAGAVDAALHRLAASG